MAEFRSLKNSIQHFVTENFPPKHFTKHQCDQIQRQNDALGRRIKDAKATINSKFDIPKKCHSSSSKIQRNKDEQRIQHENCILERKLISTYNR